MATYTRPAQLQQGQRRRFAGTIKKHEEYHESLAQDGKEDLKDATSGSLSKRDQRGWRPYARRPLTAKNLALGLARGKKGVGTVDSGTRQVSRKGRVLPYPVNRWTGKLQSGIFLSKKGAHVYDLGSSAKQAKYLFNPKGTKYMVPRGIMGERSRHGQDGVIRRRFRARVQGIILAVRDYQRGSP